jgi:dTDP-glucose pyrophosphorylase/CBS domain-containing protein
MGGNIGQITINHQPSTINIGSLERQTRLEKLLIAADATVRDAIEAIDRGGAGIALMVSPQRRLVATITDGDIRRASLAQVSHDTPARSVIAYRSERHREPAVATPRMSIAAIRHLFQARSVRQLPVLDDEWRVVDLIELSEMVDDGEPMSAVIMAGGFGKRLLPLTKSTPKPMLPVGDRPLLERIMNQLQRVGIHNVTMTLHYKPEVIKQHFQDGARFGVKVNYLSEEQPLGTAGALGLMEPPAGTTLIINGDILTNVNIPALYNWHREHDADMTVATRSYEFQVPYGVVEMEGVNILRLVEKPVKCHFVAAGIYLLEPRVFACIPKGERLDMPELINRVVKERLTVVNFPIRESWLDIGRPADYERADMEVRKCESVKV